MWQRIKEEDINKNMLKEIPRGDQYTYYKYGKTFVRKLEIEDLPTKQDVLDWLDELDERSEYAITDVYWEVKC